jgi:hypothetical protein
MVGLVVGPTMVDKGAGFGPYSPVRPALWGREREGWATASAASFQCGALEGGDEDVRHSWA